LRTLLLLAAGAGPAPASAARYYLCAFRCPACKDSWTSCRPEPCAAALEEDGCADGSAAVQLQLSPPAAAPADADEAASARADAALFEFRLALRRNGTEAQLDGPAACLRLLPPPTPVPPSNALAARLGVFARWGTFKERCAVGAKLALACERELAEAPAAILAQLDAPATCEAAMARVRRALRSMRSCHLGRNSLSLPDALPDSAAAAEQRGGLVRPQV